MSLSLLKELITSALIPGHSHNKNSLVSRKNKIFIAPFLERAHIILAHKTLPICDHCALSGRPGVIIRDLALYKATTTYGKLNQCTFKRRKIVLNSREREQ